MAMRTLNPLCVRLQRVKAVVQGPLAAASASPGCWLLSPPDARTPPRSAACIPSPPLGRPQDHPHSHQRQPHPERSPAPPSSRIRRRKRNLPSAHGDPLDASAGDPAAGLWECARASAPAAEPLRSPIAFLSQTPPHSSGMPPPHIQSYSHSRSDSSSRSRPHAQHLSHPHVHSHHHFSAPSQSDPWTGIASPPAASLQATARQRPSPEHSLHPLHSPAPSPNATAPPPALPLRTTAPWTARSLHCAAHSPSGTWAAWAPVASASAAPAASAFLGASPSLSSRSFSLFSSRTPRESDRPQEASSTPAATPAPATAPQAVGSSSIEGKDEEAREEEGEADGESRGGSSPSEAEASVPAEHSFGDGASLADGADAVDELAAAAAHAWEPTAALQWCIHAIHVATDWPWWLSIAAMTVCMRVALFPLSVYQIRNAAKNAVVAPQMAKMVERVKAYNYAPEEVQRYQDTVRALMKKHNVNPFAPVVGALAQATTFIFFFFAIRGMAENMPSFSSGGALWFKDLLAPDPFYALPLLTGLTMLAALELGTLEGMEMQQQQNLKNMKLFMRGMAVVSVPITATFPPALFCYMIPNTLLSISQGLLLRNKRIRHRLGLPQAVPGITSPGPASANAPVLSDRPPVPRRQASDVSIGSVPKRDPASKVGSVASALPPKRAAAKGKGAA